MLLFVSSIGCSVIPIAGSRAFLLIEKSQTATVLLKCFDTTTFLQNLVLK